MRRVHLNNSSSPPKEKTEAELEREREREEGRIGEAFLCVVIPARSRMPIKLKDTVQTEFLVFGYGTKS